MRIYKLLIDEDDSWPEVKNYLSQNFIEKLTITNL